MKKKSFVHFLKYLFAERKRNILTDHVIFFVGFGRCVHFSVHNTVQLGTFLSNFCVYLQEPTQRRVLVDICSNMWSSFVFSFHRDFECSFHHMIVGATKVHPYTKFREKNNSTREKSHQNTNIHWPFPAAFYVCCCFFWRSVFYFTVDHKFGGRDVFRFELVCRWWQKACGKWLNGIYVNLPELFMRENGIINVNFPQSIHVYIMFRIFFAHIIRRKYALYSNFGRARFVLTYTHTCTIVRRKVCLTFNTWMNKAKTHNMCIISAVIAADAAAVAIMIIIHRHHYYYYYNVY